VHIKCYILITVIFITHIMLFVHALSTTVMAMIVFIIINYVVYHLDELV